MNLRIISLYVFLLFLFSGCNVSKILPVCQQLSKDHPCGVKGYEQINLVTYNYCIKNHIKITPLSNIVAEFKGRKRKMRKLEEKYHLLVCDFNPDSHAGANTNETICSQCLKFSQLWIETVQGKKIDTISSAKLKYLHFCIDKH